MTQLARTEHRPTTTRRATRTGPGEGDAYWFYGDLAVVRSPEGALPIIIEHHISAGASTPLHIHVDVDDSFYVLAGTLAVRSGDDSFVAEPGDYVSMPEGEAHALRAMGPDEVVILQTHKGPAFLDFIRAVGTPVSKGQPDPATLDYAAMNVVARETGQPVVGPPMTAEDGDAIVAAGRHSG